MVHILFQKAQNIVQNNFYLHFSYFKMPTKLQDFHLTKNLKKKIIREKKVYIIITIKNKN
jgi:hypothetical protein